MDIMGYISEVLEYPLIEPDPVDEDFLYLILEGYTSAYSIWSSSRKEATRARDSGYAEIGRGMAYKNIHKRLKRLIESGLLKQVKSETINIHGRKDYEVSSIGLIYLFSDLADHHLDKLIVSHPNNSLFENFVYPIFERETLKSCIYEKSIRSRWTFSLYNLLESYLEEVSVKTRYWLNPVLLEKFSYNISLPLSRQEDPDPLVYPPVNVLEFQLKWTISSFLTRVAFMKAESISWASRESDEKLKFKERHRLMEVLAHDKKFMNMLRQDASNFRKGFDELVKLEASIR